MAYRKVNYFNRILNFIENHEITVEKNLSFDIN